MSRQGNRDDHGYPEEPWNNARGSRSMTDLDGLVAALRQAGVTDVSAWDLQSDGSECVKAHGHYGTMPVSVYVNHATAGVYYQESHRHGEVCFIHAELMPFEINGRKGWIVTTQLQALLGR